MRIQSVMPTTFNGHFIDTPALKEFSSGLNNLQKYIFNNQMELVKSVPDGKIYKFDKRVISQSPFPAENDATYKTGFGIYEQITIGAEKTWALIYGTETKNAAWCFDQLFKKYKDTALA